MLAMVVRLLLLSVAVLSPIRLSQQQVTGQTQAECTAALINGLSPCLSYITGRTNGSSPSTVCCGSLLSLSSTSSGCLCLLNNVNGPLGRISINRSLALSLPGACSIPSMELNCKDASSTKTSTAMPPVTATQVSAPAMSPPAPLVQGMSPSIPPPIDPSSVLQGPMKSSSQETHGFSTWSTAVFLIGMIML